MVRRFSRTDDAYVVVPVCMGDNEQFFKMRCADCDVSTFINRMIGVEERHGQWITKHCRGFVERNLVFLNVPGCLVCIPFKLQVHSGGRFRGDCSLRDVY